MTFSADRIAQAVIQHYESLPSSCKPKIEQLEFTVLSAVVATVSISPISPPNPNSPYSTKYIVLCMGTGTKCIGEEFSNDDGCMLQDSHAEVLARRSFVRYLLSWITKISENKKSLLDPLCPLNLDLAVEMRFSIKETWKFHLYVSDHPCGDASIYKVLDITNFNKSRNSNLNNLINRSNDIYSITGAKVIETKNDKKDEDLNATRNEIDNTIQIENNEKYIKKDTEIFQIVGAVRTKSCRTDVVKEFRTNSMSCSDKICKWNTIGFQGFFICLFFLKPILLNNFNNYLF
jgi:tRNA-specific adenosine deaminase 1